MDTDNRIEILESGRGHDRFYTSITLDGREAAELWEKSDGSYGLRSKAYWLAQPAHT